jgi:hypothetical protein
MDVIVAHKSEILLFLFALSEILALIPSLKANSVFQLIAVALKKAAGK